MKYLAGFIGFLFIMALYWIGGGEFERGPWLAWWIAIAVHVGFFVMWLWSERK